MRLFVRWLLGGAPRPYDPWKCKECGSLKSRACGRRVTRHKYYQRMGWNVPCPLDLRFFWDRWVFKLLGRLP